MWELIKGMAGWELEEFPMPHCDPFLHLPLVTPLSYSYSCLPVTKDSFVWFLLYLAPPPNHD